MPPGSQYVIQDGRICRQKQTSQGVVTVPLCNFVAKIVDEVVLDNGLDTSRVWVIEGQLQHGEALPRIRVPVPRFASMTWVAEQWGVRAVVHAGQATRDYLREAIQHLSKKAAVRRVYTHTGWRKVDSNWVYLTSNGALGHKEIEVELGAALARYQLPSQVQDPVAAMRASLTLLEVAPLNVTVPLWSAAYRAPLVTALPVDVSLWLEGTTGALKSSLTAVFLSHFGHFDHLHLPGSWSSTASFLEHQAFVLKDTLFVVDDYAPQMGLDNRELDTKAARLVRAQGNLSGRGRLTPDSTERPGLPPRGLVVATGEQHPTGRSILARIFLVEVQRTAVDRKALSAAQANLGALSEAMAGYLDWLAPQMTWVRGTLPSEFEAIREHATQGDEHLRVPAAVAHLYLGLDYGLHYAEVIGACSNAEAVAFREKGWEALCALGKAQGGLVAEERPTVQFLRTLASLITQGRAWLLPRSKPAVAAKGPGPSAALVGWHDEENIYLLPEAAFELVTKARRDAGNPFPIREGRLRQELAEEQLSEGDEGRLLKTVKIGGKNHRTVCLGRARVEAALGEGEQFPVVPSVPTSGK